MEAQFVEKGSFMILIKVSNMTNMFLSKNKISPSHASISGVYVELVLNLALPVTWKKPIT